MCTEEEAHQFLKKLIYLSDDRYFGTWNGYHMDKQKKGDYDLKSVAYTSSGVLWGVGMNRDICEWDMANGTWKNHGNIANSNPLDIAFDKDDNMYIVTEEGNVGLWKDSSFELNQLPQKVRALDITMENVCWAVTTDWKVIRYELDTKEKRDFGNVKGLNVRGIAAHPSSGYVFLAEETRRKVHIWHPLDDTIYSNDFVTGNTSDGGIFQLERICFPNGSIELVDIEYLVDDESAKRSLSDLTVGTSELVNNEQTQQAVTLKFRQVFTKTVVFDWSSINSSKNSDGFSVKFGIPIIGGGTEVSTNFAFNGSFKIGEKSTTTETEEVIVTYPVNVSPNSHVFARCVVSRGTLSCPFVATFKNEKSTFQQKGIIKTENFFDTTCSYEEI